jgi:hypothetical protein
MGHYRLTLFGVISCMHFSVCYRSNTSVYWYTFFLCLVFGLLFVARIGMWQWCRDRFFVRVGSCRGADVCQWGDKW